VPDLIVRLLDGRHTAIALSGTDYLSPPEVDPPPRPDHLLDLDGLRLILQVLDRRTADRRTPPTRCPSTPSAPAKPC
jgi:hypothetical protein